MYDWEGGPSPWKSLDIWLMGGGGGGASCLHKTLGQQLLGTRMQPAFVNIRYSYREHVARRMQRVFNYIDDNALINQILAPLDVQ
jgi:hypothetical protein